MDEPSTSVVLNTPVCSLLSAKPVLVLNTLLVNKVQLAEEVKLEPIIKVSSLEAVFLIPPNIAEQFPVTKLKEPAPIKEQSPDAILSNPLTIVAFLPLTVLSLPPNIEPLLALTVLQDPPPIVALPIQQVQLSNNIQLVFPPPIVLPVSYTHLTLPTNREV